VWEERNNIAASAVGAWDIGPNGLAEARPQILSEDAEILRTLHELRRSGSALGSAWRLKPHDELTADAAWRVHHNAIERFVIASFPFQYDANQADPGARQPPGAARQNNPQTPRARIRNAGNPG
jgi:hypothetical protein